MEHCSRVSGFIRASHAQDGSQFDRLALDLFKFQFANNPAYRKHCERVGGTPGTVRTWKDAPAIVTSAFKDLDLSALPEPLRTAVFHSSETLRLYADSLLAWFKPHLLPELDGPATRENMRASFLILSPQCEEAPHSSLAHMFSVVADRLGTDARFVARIGADGGWALD